MHDQNSKQNILFYGNCQISAIHMILNLNPLKFNITVIECFSTNVTEIEIYNCIKECDIIISQHIEDNYRDKSYLSTNYILNNCKKECKIIFLNNCYFDFYYFDTTMKPFTNEYCFDPCLYHYSSLVDCYKNNKSTNYYIENYIDNKDLKNKDELEKIANASLKELENRYETILNYKNKNITCINIIDYIKQNYKKELLFHSINHPTKILLQYVCHQIIYLLNLQNSINYDIDPLNYVRCILYKCIKNVVNFEIDNIKPYLLDETKIEKIVEMYYNSYSSLKNYNK